VNLDRLLRPKSVAVVGGTEAGRVIEQLDLLGYTGEVWPVHPTRPEMLGRRCVASTDDLPAAPDVAFVAVPRDATPDVVTALADRGTGSAVVYTSGFAESGARELQDQLVVAAGAMPLLGPNCYGYVNALDRTAIWPDVHGLRPVDRGVAIITQSGNIGINLTMARRSLDIGLLITAGNQAKIDLPALMEAMLDDPRITAIGVQLESITDSRAFGHAVLRAREMGIPVVALRMGTSEKGSLATASHTGALVGDDAAYGALFARYGVARVRTMPAFLETLKLAGRIPHRPRIVSLSASGGEAAHVADLGHDAGIDLPALEPSHAAAIAETVGPLVAVSNPMDYHTFSWGDEDRMRQTFTAVVNGRFDVSMLVLDFPATEVPDAWWAACRAFAAACGELIPGLVVASLPETMPVAAQERLRDFGLVPMLGIGEAIEALAALGAVENADVGVHGVPATRGREAATLDEAASKRLLASAGIPVPRSETLSDPTATALPFPLTVKVLGIDHKTDVGAVAVGIHDAEQLVRTIAAMPVGERYLVEETIEDGVLELLVSVRAVDHMGWLITLGAGGRLVEVMEDRTHLLAPAGRSAIDVALRQLRVVARCRAPEPPDLEAAVDAVFELQAMCDDGPVLEAEINPLIVTPSRAVAVDAMVTLA
jgi:acetyl-CoA synthetase